MVDYPGQENGKDRCVLSQAMRSIVRRDTGQGGRTFAAASMAMGTAGAGDEEETTEDKINRLMESKRLLPNASYFAFTATLEEQDAGDFRRARTQGRARSIPQLHDEAGDTLRPGGRFRCLGTSSGIRWKRPVHPESVVDAAGIALCTGTRRPTDDGTGRLATRSGASAQAPSIQAAEGCA